MQNQTHVGENWRLEAPKGDYIWYRFAPVDADGCTYPPVPMALYQAAREVHFMESYDIMGSLWELTMRHLREEWQSPELTALMCALHTHLGDKFTEFGSFK